ncbi:hypothetical protein Tco_0179308 [Tanacetum coccineum]
MSETEPIPPTSSVTALRIPIIKKDGNLEVSKKAFHLCGHVVDTLIRGQPGLDDVRLDDLYNNSKVYEHGIEVSQIQTLKNIGFSGPQKMKSYVPSLSQASYAPTTQDDEACCKLMTMLWKKLTFDG